MKRLKYLALAAVVAFAACDEEGGGLIEPVDQFGTVTGSVTAEGTGIAGVSVSISAPGQTPVTTAAGGTFTFSSVPTGNHVVTISGVPGDFVCTSTSQTVTVAANQTTTISFACTVVRTASISGTVSSSTAPIADATVTISGAGTGTETTNANGQYQFTGLRSGTYTVTLTPPTGVTCATTSIEVALIAGEAEVVNFVCEGGAEAPTITIERITVGGAGTTVPADPDSLAARVEVTVNIDRNHNDLDEFQLLAVAADGTVFEICRQTFTSGAPEAVHGGTDELSITCSWNTDRTRDITGASTIRTSTAIDGDFAAIGADPLRPFNPVYLNGDFELVARVTTVDNQAATAAVDVTLINTDAVILGVTADNTDWNDPTTGSPFPNFIIDSGTGLRWLSGDVEVIVYPVIFSAPFDPNNPALARASFMFNGFRVGADVTVGGTENTTPNANGTFTFTFCEAAAGTATDGGACYARINAFNTGAVGARNVTLVTKTQFGQFGPTLANLKSIQLFDQDLASGTRGLINDVLRVDTEGPVAGAMTAAGLPHPADALPGIPDPTFSRTAFLPPAVPPFPGSHLGWVAWTDGLNTLVTDPASDNPNTYPAGATGPDQILGTADDVLGWCDPAADFCAAAGATLAGIGLPAGANKPELVHVRGPGYADPTDTGFDATPTVAEIVSGAQVKELTVAGDDLPPEDGIGLTDQCPAGPVCSAAGTPYSDTELDYGIAALHWDRFGNKTNTGNFLLLGVDGKEPIYSNAAGIAAANPTDPTTAGTVYDPFDDDQHVTSETFATFGQVLDAALVPNMLTESQKARGTLKGWTTDRGNGFSGVAGVAMEDWESFCAGILTVCAGAETGNRFGWTLAAGAGGATVVLPFEFAEPESGLDTFLPVGFDAYVAANFVEASMDGYRDQRVRSYDRAGNLNIFAAINEGNADHTPPGVGNVNMPTPPVFDYTTNYTWGGEARDAVDLKKTDLSFDFNSILGLQMFVDPQGADADPAPVADVGGNLFQETSLQLPLQNVSHTAFGSGAILRLTNLSAQRSFLGCLVRADEMGTATLPSSNLLGDVGPVEPYVHRPRGPRWRTWDHSFLYGLVNSQFNTFTPSSVPACRTVAQMMAGITPAPSVGGFGGLGPDGVAGTPDDDVAWQFEIRSGAPVITFKGPTATFVPNVDVTAISLYYLDTAGRAILWDQGSSAWTLIVSDLGAGAYGRSYEYTYTGSLPEDLISVALPPTNGTTSGWFFVLNLSGANAGHAFIWDRQSN